MRKHADNLKWLHWLAVSGCLLLCSCKLLQTTPSGEPAAGAAVADSSVLGTMPPGAYGPVSAGPRQPTDYGPKPPEGNAITTHPAPFPAWAPPNTKLPWPEDEFIHDGGDDGAPVGVAPNWEVHGLELEDTVAHYDTLDGQTKIEPSSCVTIYAPRFAAVRAVRGPILNEQVVNPVGASADLPLLQMRENQLAISRQQNLQLGRQVGRDKAQGYTTDRWRGIASQTLQAVAFDNRFKAHENFAIIRYGLVDQREKPYLAQAVDAALIWSHDLALQVVLDAEAATAVHTYSKPQETYVVHETGRSKLRLCKVASKGAAQPGDIIDFTLRFDNVGDKIIGNVVIIDNLTTRLEYVEDSSQWSVKAGFLRDEQGNVVFEEVQGENGQVKKLPKYRQNPVHFATSVNEGDSLTLRWELEEPLEPGQGGIIRFKCRVR